MTKHPHGIVNAREISRITKLVNAILVEFGMPTASWSFSPHIWVNTHRNADGSPNPVPSVTWDISIHPTNDLCFYGHGVTIEEAFVALRAKLVAHMATMSVSTTAAA